MYSQPRALVCTLALGALLSAGCGTPQSAVGPTSTLDRVATDVAVAQAVAATLTAAVPTSEVAPTEQATPPGADPPTPTVAVATLAPVASQATANTPPPPTDIPAQPTDAPPAPTDTPLPTRVVLQIFPPTGDTSQIGGGFVLPGDAQAAQSEPLDAVTFSGAMWFRTVAYELGQGEDDGANIAQVAFTIADDTAGGIVHERVERNAGYCVFGGGEPDCALWDFAAHDNTWPDGQHTLDPSHTYRAQALVTTKSGSETLWFFTFSVQP